jgi:hypothetical protein
MKNKRIMLLLTGVVLTALFFIAGCSTVKGKTDEEPMLAWIHFDWETLTLGERSFENASMLVPVIIDNLPQKFNMQFDLGANEIMFYGNTIASFLEHYPSLAEKLHKTEYSSRFSSISLGLGAVVLDDITVANMENYGEMIMADNLDPDEEIHIGTIGSQITWNKILIIDYPGQRFAVTETMPQEYQSLPAIECELREWNEPWGGKFLFPLMLNGKTEKVVFDTGSSMFFLITSKEKTMSIADPDVVDTMTAESWGQAITINGHEIVKDVYFGDKNLKGQTVYYDISGSTGDNFSGDIWGVIGNVPFIENIVILDYVNKTVRIK